MRSVCVCVCVRERADHRFERKWKNRVKGRWTIRIRKEKREQCRIARKEEEKEGERELPQAIAMLSIALLAHEGGNVKESPQTRRTYRDALTKKRMKAMQDGRFYYYYYHYHYVCERDVSHSAQKELPVNADSPCNGTTNLNSKNVVAYQVGE